MKTKWIIFFVIAILAIVSCTRYSDDLELALILAGGNREELESVLEHYRAQPKDSLKYQAACFLIENMPGRYSEDLRRVDEYMPFIDHWVEILQQGEKCSQADLDSITLLYRMASSQHKIPDVEFIKAEFLINNIERSFDVWTYFPWCKDISFDIFCEEILPYRVSTEPIEYWRDKVLEDYKSIIDSLQYLGYTNTLDVCKHICQSMNWTWRPYVMPFPAQSYSMAEKSRSGTCEDRTAFGAFIMRSLGIPVTIDYTPQWPNRTSGHKWNTVRDSSGLHIPFTATSDMPGDNPLKNRKLAKVYRDTWQQKKMKDNPNRKQNFYHKDVSSEYFDAIDVIFDNISANSKFADLCVFDNQNWVPVQWSKVSNHKVCFKDMGRDIVYLLRSENIDSTYPFLLTEQGEKYFYIPDKAQMQKLHLVRKYPLMMTYVNDRMRGGYFEMSNSPDFEQAEQLYKIDATPDLCFHDVDIATEQSARYTRYMSPDGSYGNIAELEFYGMSGQRLTGIPMGTIGSKINGRPYTIHQVFDGDVLTFFDSPWPSYAWVGLDFETPEVITQIRYLPRNDDNHIAVGQSYELFYWGEKGWVSLGQKIAYEQVLYYNNAPKNALFLLRNLSKGKEERIFSYENDKQIWW